MKSHWSHWTWQAPLLAASLLGGAAHAAGPTEASTVQRLEREQIERLMQERQLQQAPVQAPITLPAPTPAPQVSHEANIPVTRFAYGASEILSAEEIHAALRPYEGRTLSLSDLLDAVEAINRLYLAKNMPTARAFLPPQDLQDGVVQLRLVEAHVGQLSVEGLQTMHPAFVQERMGLKSGDLMSVPALENDLLRFNRLHDTQLRASVQPGSQFGTTDVLLQPEEPARYQNSVFLDNGGRYTVGETRLGLVSHVYDVSGNSDNLLLSITNSSGSNSYLLNYTRPLNAQDLSLDLSLSQGDITVVEGSFAPLNVTGSSKEFSMGLSAPLEVSSQRLWNAYARLANKRAISVFGGAPQQDDTLTVLTLGSNIQQQQQEQAWNADLSISQGSGDGAAQSSFTVMRANAAWLANFAERSQFMVRGALQYSNDDLLPSSEQFQLGGNSTVRGFSEGLLSARRGYLLSLEYRHDLSTDGPFYAQYPEGPHMQFLAFVDYGAALPYRPKGQAEVQDDDFLSSYGLGMQYDWGKRANLRVTAAAPMRPNANESRSHTFFASFTVNWP